MSQRIGYIDAIRGFTMMLVVYNHVLVHSFGGDANWGFNSIFITFRMPLFFFISGFLMYKTDLFKQRGSLRRFLGRKARVQLVPTLIFAIAYVCILRVPFKSLLVDKAKCGFWFTYTLFFYFLIYAVGDVQISKYLKGKYKIFVGTGISFLVYAISKFSLSPVCPWFHSSVNGIIGFANYQYFIFFYVGALYRAFFQHVEIAMDNVKVNTVVISGFVLLQFILQHSQTRDWIIAEGSYSAYSLLRSFSGFWGIATVFLFFRKNGDKIMQCRFGRFLQYIGKRTLEIYFIHTILIHTDLSFMGDFLSRGNSYIAEMLLGGGMSLIIILLCLLISQIIRCSDTLAKLLFGKVIKDDQGI